VLAKNPGNKVLSRLKPNSNKFDLADFRECQLMPLVKDLNGILLTDYGVRCLGYIKKCIVTSGKDVITNLTI
jgi:hypothetical protein